MTVKEAGSEVKKKSDALQLLVRWSGAFIAVGPAVEL